MMIVKQTLTTFFSVVISDLNRKLRSSLCLGGAWSVWCTPEQDPPLEKIYFIAIVVMEIFKSEPAPDFSAKTISLSVTTA